MNLHLLISCNRKWAARRKCVSRSSVSMKGLYTMQTNNNPLTEIGAIVLAAVLIIIKGLLLYVGKIDNAFSTSMFILSGANFDGKIALTHPYPNPQAALLPPTHKEVPTQA